MLNGRRIEADLIDGKRSYTDLVAEKNSEVLGIKIEHWSPKEQMEKNIREEHLLHSLRICWEHIRHIETQRLQLFYFQIIIILAIFSTGYVHGFLSVFFTLILFFLSIFSLVVYLCNLKWNAVLSEYVTTIQWVSEKLGLIKKMEDEEEENLKLELKKIGVKKFYKYSSFKDMYIPIPAPLSIRVHEVAFTLFPRIITASSFAFANGLLIYCILAYFFNLSVINMGIISFVYGMITGLGMWHYCGYILKKIKQESVIYKKARKPKDVTIWDVGVEEI